MILTTSALRKIINEEYKALIEGDKARKSKRRPMTRREREEASERTKVWRRKEDLKLGSHELHGIMHGIYELNDEHLEDGTFGDAKNSTCTSTYFVDGKRKRKAGKLTDKDSTGRGVSKTGQGKYRCKDNSPKWESIVRDMEEDDKGYVNIKKDALRRLVAGEMNQMAKDYLEQEEIMSQSSMIVAPNIMEQGQGPTKLSRQQHVDVCRKMGMKTWDEFLITLSRAIDATKGQLTKPQTK